MSRSLGLEITTQILTIQTNTVQICLQMVSQIYNALSSYYIQLQLFSPIKHAASYCTDSNLNVYTHTIKIRDDVLFTLFIVKIQQQQKNPHSMQVT